MLECVGTDYCTFIYRYLPVPAKNGIALLLGVSELSVAVQFTPIVLADDTLQTLVLSQARLFTSRCRMER